MLFIPKSEDSVSSVKQKMLIPAPIKVSWFIKVDEDQFVNWSKEEDDR